jgi:hypothetical protein
MALRLNVNSHHDACVISNAMREYCDKKVDEYHYLSIKAYQMGNNIEGERCYKMARAVQRCHIRTIERLNKIIERFESQMPDDID